MFASVASAGVARAEAVPGDFEPTGGAHAIVFAADSGEQGSDVPSFPYLSLGGHAGYRF